MTVLAYLASAVAPAAPPGSVSAGPDVVAAGQVLSELEGWAAILFVAIILIALLIAALLAVVFYAFNAWSKNLAALAAIRETMVGTNTILARLESRYSMEERQ